MPLVLIVAALVGCGPDECGDGARCEGSPPDLFVSLSDRAGADLGGHGEVLVRPDALPSVRINIVASHEDSVDVGGNPSNDELASLASGVRTTFLDPPQLHHDAPDPSADYTRPVEAATLTVAPGEVDLRLELGARSTGEGSETADAVVRGQLPIACSPNTTGVVEPDAEWTSPACARARDELGLAAWIGAF